jgi:subtilisin family serine protease
VQRNRRRFSAVVIALSVVLSSVLLAAPVSARGSATRVAPEPPPVDPGSSVMVPADVSASISQGPTEVIVGIDSPGAAAAFATAADSERDPATRRAALASAAAELGTDKEAVLANAGSQVRSVQSYEHLPVEVVTVDSPAALAALAGTAGVTSITLPRTYRLTTDSDLEIIGQPAAQAAGFTGAGVSVAVIDSGVDYLRPGVGDTFGNCAAGPGTGTCRIDRLIDMVSSGSRDTNPDGHGTNVAGIVAKTAPGAHLDVYGVFDADGNAYDAIILAALDDVIDNAAARGTRAVNMSLGDGAHADFTCSTAFTGVFASLRALDILPIVSSGNSAYDVREGSSEYFFFQGISSPACTAGAISVGATYPEDYAGYSLDYGSCLDDEPAADSVACFSQGGPTLSMLAPGVEITAAGITGTGTSQAAPHVAGAVAAMAQANPGATGDQLAAFLTGTGPWVTDQRDLVRTRRLDMETATAAAAAATNIDTAGSFVSLAPARLLDTRFGVGAPAGALGFGQTLTLTVNGQGGVPPAGVSAVALNVTVTDTEAAGFLTAYRPGPDRPLASNLNFVAGQTVPNLVIAPVGANGDVALYNGAPGKVQIVADIAGYYLDGAPTEPGGFGSVTPLRVLDTRFGTGAPAASVGYDKTVSVQVTGAGGVPASNVSAVVLNVTVTDPAAAGFITAYASGKNRPLASNLNFSAGQTVPNLVVAPVGTDGRVVLYNGAPGSVQLVADIAGYFRSGTVTEPGGLGSVAPLRLLDTRDGTGAPASSVPYAGTVSVAVTGKGGVPATTVAAVVLNVTVTGASAAGFITAYASGSTRPNASNLNFVAGQTVPNLVIAPVGADGKVTLYNGAPGSVHLVADIAGYVVDGT